MKTQFNELLQQLPSKSEVPSLLNDISQARAANGLKEELFKPMAEENRDFYVELPNALVVTGDYNELAHFSSDVAALSRIVTLQNVTIKPIDKKKNSTENSGLLRMSVTATTYRYNEGNKNDNMTSANGGS
jgi:type IV pilus assembly protein PilO